MSSSKSTDRNSYWNSSTRFCCRFFISNEFVLTSTAWPIVPCPGRGASSFWTSVNSSRFFWRSVLSASIRRLCSLLDDFSPDPWLDKDVAADEEVFDCDVLPEIGGIPRVGRVTVDRPRFPRVTRPAGFASARPYAGWRDWSPLPAPRGYFLGFIPLSQ